MIEEDIPVFYNRDVNSDLTELQLQTDSKRIAKIFLMWKGLDSKYKLSGGLQLSFYSDSLLFQ